MLYSIHYSVFLRERRVTQAAERGCKQMQQVLDKRSAPAYVEKITLYFAPDGWIVVVVGNQRFHATSEEVENF